MTGIIGPMTEYRRETPLTEVKITPEDCTADVKYRVVSSMPFLRDLDDEEIRGIEPSFLERGFAAGDRIETNGEKGRGLYIVGAGLVRLVRTDYDGRDVVLDILVTGEIFGSAAGGTRADMPFAHTNACVFHVSESDLGALLADYPGVAAHLFEMTSRRIATLHERLHELSGASVKTRVIETLKRLAWKVGTNTDEGVLLQVPLSREDLASLSGTTTETTSRVVSALQKHGYLKTGRRWFTITQSLD